MTHITDRALLRSLMVEILKEDKILFQEVVKEVAEVHKEMGIKDGELQTLLEKNFARYDEVYKALA